MSEVLGYIHLAVASILILTILILYVIWRYYRRYFVGLLFIAFAVNVAFITAIYAPYYLVKPVGTVVVPTNYTTVIGNTTYVYNVSLTKTVYQQSGEMQGLMYIGLMVALIAAVLGFLFLVLVAFGTITNLRIRKR